MPAGYQTELEKRDKRFELRYQSADGNLIELEKLNKSFEPRCLTPSSVSDGA
jgi:hypothetical protein